MSWAKNSLPISGMSDRNGITIGLQLDTGNPDKAFTPKAGQTKAQNGQRQTGGHLIGDQGQDQKSEQQRKQRPDH